MKDAAIQAADRVKNSGQFSEGRLILLLLLRPASKATVMRVILCPAFAASSRHRCSSFSNAFSSTASFFSG
jgi:hypothetical protein